MSTTTCEIYLLTILLSKFTITSITLADVAGHRSTGKKCKISLLMFFFGRGPSGEAKVGAREITYKN